MKTTTEKKRDGCWPSRNNIYIYMYIGNGNNNNIFVCVRSEEYEETERKIIFVQYLPYTGIIIIIIIIVARYP